MRWERRRYWYCPNLQLGGGVVLELLVPLLQADRSIADARTPLRTAAVLERLDIHKSSLEFFCQICLY